MLTRRWVLGGLIAAPAVIAANKLMPVHVIPERWATVWGVGWDLEVVEVPLWKPMSVAQFGGPECLGGHIEKFREVTDWIYTNPSVSSVLPTHYPHWHDRDYYINEPMNNNNFELLTTPVQNRWFGARSTCNGTTRIHKLDLKNHWGNRHAEHLADLEKCNRTRNDMWEIEGKDQHRVDVAHMYELSTGNSDKWDYDKWAAFMDANKATGQLPKVKFKPAVKSIV